MILRRTILAMNVRRSIAIAVACIVIWAVRLVLSLYWAVEVTNWTLWACSVLLGFGLPLAAGYHLNKVILYRHHQHRCHVE